jgi:hypothetical protein
MVEFNGAGMPEMHAIQRKGVYRIRSLHNAWEQCRWNGERPADDTWTM